MDRLQGGPQRRRLANTRRVGRLGDPLRGHSIDDLLLRFDLALIVIAVAKDPERAAHATVSLEHDARQQFLALLKPKPLDVEMGHPDPPGVVGGVLTVMGVHAHRHTLQKVGDPAGLGHAVRVAEVQARSISSIL
jgi:hypothetical protein